MDDLSKQQTIREWNDIPGWFDFNEIYDFAVAKAPEKAVFVEIGSFLGRSTAYMAQLIQSSGKDISFYAVDLFDSYESHDDPNQKLADFEAMFRHNLSQCGLLEQVNILKMRSSEAVQRFEDQTLDFVFIDGDHSYDGFWEDIVSWFPKIKYPSVFAGHDYPYYEGVKRGVHEFLELAPSEKLLPEEPDTGFRHWHNSWYIDDTHLSPERWERLRTACLNKRKTKS